MDQIRVHGMGGVHKDDGLPPAELRPDRLEGVMAEVVVAVSIPREERDAIRMEFVQSVGNLFDRRFGVDKRRQGREEAVLGRILGHQRIRVLVALARQRLCLRRVLFDTRSRGRDGENRRLVPDARRELAVFLLAPWGYVPAGWITASPVERCSLLLSSLGSNQYGDSLQESVPWRMTSG